MNGAGEKRSDRCECVCALCEEGALGCINTRGDGGGMQRAAGGGARWRRARVRSSFSSAIPCWSRYQVLRIHSSPHLRSQRHRRSLTRWACVAGATGFYLSGRCCSAVHQPLVQNDPMAGGYQGLQHPRCESWKQSFPLWRSSRSYYIEAHAGRWERANKTCFVIKKSLQWTARVPIHRYVQSKLISRVMCALRSTTIGAYFMAEHGKKCARKTHPLRRQRPEARTARAAGRSACRAAGRLCRWTPPRLPPGIDHGGGSMWSRDLGQGGCDSSTDCRPAADAHHRHRHASIAAAKPNHILGRFVCGTRQIRASDRVLPNTSGSGVDIIVVVVSSVQGGGCRLAAPHESIVVSISSTCALVPGACLSGRPPLRSSGSIHTTVLDPI